MFTSISKFRKELTGKFSKVNVNDIQDEELKAKFRKLKGKQRGFTLLELLVVVSILAAIAGTATLALQDTDARAAAAAHVAMMDELNKGIRTYKALNKAFPDELDSLMQTTATAIPAIDSLSLPVGASTVSLLPNGDSNILAIEDVELVAVPATVVAAMNDAGMESVRVVINNATPAVGNPEDSAGLNCGNLQSLIGGRSNAVVSGNIFMSPSVNGCGVTHRVIQNDQLAFWTGGSERITGKAELAGWNTNGNTAFLALGVGPSSNLFDTTTLGGMTSVPVYRHVSKDQYNRFVAIFAVGTHDTGANACLAGATNAAVNTALLTAVPDLTYAPATVYDSADIINSADLAHLNDPLTLIADVRAEQILDDALAEMRTKIAGDLAGFTVATTCDGTVTSSTIGDAAWDIDFDALVVVDPEFYTGAVPGGAPAGSASLTGVFQTVAIKTPEQVQLVAVVDGAGDTKEEELGEWDGTRNTI